LVDVAVVVAAAAVAADEVVEQVLDSRELIDRSDQKKS
jgi:hypothetical protein